MAEAAENYQVNIPLFEGPLDLLLHLVTKNRIDIHDIPIHLITDQYLAYLESARQFNLDLGSSFFAMAATLLLIKSRMLLPEKRREETDEAEDPRQELSRSLEEFKRMKEVKARIEALMEEERPYRMREPEVFKRAVFREGFPSPACRRPSTLSMTPWRRKRKSGFLRKRCPWTGKWNGGKAGWKGRISWL